MLLNITNLTIHYGGLEAVTGINIDVEEEGIIALIGANGAGKSTILKAISGLITPTSGEVKLREERIDGLPPHEIVKKGIVQVPEGRRLFPFMSVLSNLRLGAYLRKDKKKINEDLEKVFARFPILKARKKQEAGTLSGGEQQMLAIARGLLARPTILLLDEPSLGLAPKIVQEIAGTISGINQQEKVSIVLVEQNANMALNLANKGYVLEVGRIFLEGKSRDLLGNDYIKNAYLGGKKNS